MKSDFVHKKDLLKEKGPGKSLSVFFSRSIIIQAVLVIGKKVTVWHRINALKFVVVTVRKPAYEVTDDGWLLVNINCSGYYRVNYDEQNWNRLINQLESNHKVSMFIS